VTVDLAARGTERSVRAVEPAARPRSMFRRSPRRALRAGCVLLAAAAIHAHAQRAPAPSIAGTWFPASPAEAMRTTSGAVPPLTVEGQALYDERVAARRAGDVSFDRASWCASPGLPRIMFMPYPLEIVVDPRRIAILSGWYRRYRVIDMSGERLEVVFPTSMGVSTGRWRGTRLVVETVGLSPETVLDSAGLPHTADMRLTEQFALKDADTLEVRFTVVDPVYYARPWESVMTYRRLAGQHVRDDVCLDRIKSGEPAVRLSGEPAARFE
jgi:hypothetical protein